MGYNETMRRYLQFRLRTLFILTALAALLAWAVPPVVERYRAYRENLAADEAELERAWLELTIRGSNHQKRAQRQRLGIDKPLPPRKSP